jgi:hypothetical protein
MNMPTVKLSNNLIVANFSFPKILKFRDGMELAACHHYRAKKLDVLYTRIVTATRNWRDVRVIPHLSDEVKAELKRVGFLDIDIVLVPEDLMRAVVADDWGVGSLRVPYREPGYKTFSHGMFLL